MKKNNCTVLQGGDKNKRRRLSNISASQHTTKTKLINFLFYRRSFLNNLETSDIYQLSFHAGRHGIRHCSIANSHSFSLKGFLSWKTLNRVQKISICQSQKNGTTTQSCIIHNLCFYGTARYI